MAKKLKTLRPSLREKKRYMVFEVHCGEPVSEQEASDAIWKGCLGFLGDFGIAHAGITILHNRWEQATQRGILKVSNGEVLSARSAHSLIKEAGGKQAIFTTVGISGILDKAAKGFLRKSQG